MNTNIDWLGIAKKNGYAFPDKRMESFVADLRAALQAQQGEAKAPANQCSVNDLLRVDDYPGRNPGLSSNT